MDCENPPMAAFPPTPEAPAASGKRKRMPPKRFELLDMTPSQRLEKEKQARKKQKLGVEETPETKQRDEGASSSASSSTLEISKECTTSRSREDYHAKKTKRTCTICNQSKALEEFHKLSRNRDGVRSACKACSASKRNNPPREKAKEGQAARERAKGRQPKTAAEAVEEALKCFYSIGSVFTFTLFGRVVRGQVRNFDGELLSFCVVDEDTQKGALVTMKWQDCEDFKKLPE